MRHRIDLPSRPAKLHHKTKEARNKRGEIIRQVAAIMGDELRYSQLARELPCSVGTIYYHLRKS